ncbi:MAG TPA: methionine synthase [Anaerolineales bacterium]|nr:methionine synthase [Anaerolineales bacterium]
MYFGGTNIERSGMTQAVEKEISLNERVQSRADFLDQLGRRVLVYDGAMGTSLQAMQPTPQDFGGETYAGCLDYLVISKPELVERVHRSFLEVGADVIETNSFRANRITLADFGLDDRVVEINQAAAALARGLVDEYSTPAKPRFVAGSIGPSGKLLSADDPDLSNITFDELSEIFCEQATGLIQGGADLILLETSQDLLEVKAAITGIRSAFDECRRSLPLQVQVSLDTTGRMLLGTDISAALASLERLQIDVIGLNCSTGPEHMREPIRYLGEFSRLPVSCIPNAGLPLNVDGEAVYPMQPEPFAADLVEFVEKYNISIVGGCCGTTPDHIKLLVDALQAKSQPARPTKAAANLASAIRAIPIRQEPPPLLIGERINTQGSRRAKRLLLDEDYDTVLELARDQVEGGAHALDICVALTERSDEADMMRTVVHKLAQGIEAPLVIDTTEAEVMEAALKAAPGRCLLNSINLESGRQKIDAVLPLARAHGAAVIALTIDESGMAKTPERKVAIARRIHDIVVGEYGLDPTDLVFDALTFTLATGEAEFAESAVATIEGIRRIKASLPGVWTSLGVSNVSFGLSPRARPVLNSVMLYHCVQAGLDMAIVNPSHVVPYAELAEDERLLAEDLILNRRQDALQRLIEFYDQAPAGEIGQAPVDPTAGMTPQARLHWRILHRHKEGVEVDIDEVLEPWGIEERSDGAVDLLNNVLLPAMKEVGDRFGAGELILPFVLQSAEVMKKAVAHLEQFLERREGVTKGSIVLATVYGDVHDIGKNLVKTILSNNGYTVHDLGKQVPATVIIDKAIEVEADAIGLSALLVSTSKQMPLIVNELARRNLSIPVLIGGAAINRRFGRRILFTESGDLYEPGVFYCKDAFEGLDVIDRLRQPETRERLLAEREAEARREVDRPLSPRHVGRQKRMLPPPAVIPTPPRWGPRVVREMPLELVFECIFKNELFRLSWGGKNTQGDAWAELNTEFEARLARMTREALEHPWLRPQGVYGYWPAQADGDQLVLYDPASLTGGEPQERMRFGFPRQTGGDGLCLADYFSPLESGGVDVVALQVVTVGQDATQRVDQLQSAGDYTEAYFAHGLAVQTAEAAAEYLHRHVRRELGLADGQGKRYSWGYPAIPDLQDHAKVFELLPAEDTIGMRLTAAYQLIPEQSTAAIILHHPSAKYFSVGASRVEQLMES